MARALRIEYKGAFYHVISRGNNREETFLDDTDRKQFLKYLKEQTLRYGIKIHAWCLMSNHYHLVVETPLGNLSKTMQSLNTSYTVYFNHRHRKVGHLFQGRYKAVLVQADEYLHCLSRYIHLNPVRANIVKDPGEYRWSSYKSYISKEEEQEFLTTEFILGMFSSDLRNARKLYKSFVVENIGNEVEIIRNNITGGIILGKAAFVDRIKSKLAHKEDKEMPVLKQLRKRIDIEQIKIEVKKRIENEKLSRRIYIYLIRKYTDKKLTEISALFGKISYSGISQVCRRMEKKRRENKKLDLLISEIEKVSNVKT